MKRSDWGDKIKNMKKTIYLMLLLMIFGTASIKAQVVIGSEKAPEEFSVLELISDNGVGAGTKRGLRLPQLTTAQRDALNFAGHESEALGLQIYNKKTKCVETWNGSEWIQECYNNTPVIPPVSPFVSSSCSVSTEDDLTFTCIADPYAEAYKWLGDDSQPVETTTNSITFASAQSNVSVVYLYPHAFLRPKMIDIAGAGFTIGAATTYAPAVSGNFAVTLSDFKMSETPVTQAQFSAVLSGKDTSTPFNPDKSYTFICALDIVYAPSSAKPADVISWYDAIAYCNKLSIMEGKTPVYSVKEDGGEEVDWENLTYAEIPTAATDPNWDAAVCNWSANGFRLPTEAEWEYAARGGQKSITNDISHPRHGISRDYDYSGGDVLANVGWYGGTTGQNWEDTAPPTEGVEGTATYGTQSVKGKLPNVLGLYDMSGNVMEWCWNWYQGSSYGALDSGTGIDPKGTATGSTRVLRGGYWHFDAGECRVSARYNGIPYTRSIGGSGFRVVLGQ
jgi:formylglycine-generating enzyme required for sulfatase activity